MGGVHGRGRREQEAVRGGDRRVLRHPRVIMRDGPGRVNRPFRFFGGSRGGGGGSVMMKSNMLSF